MLEAVNLSKRYEDGNLALDNLNLKIGEGEIFCLLGANVAGIIIPFSGGLFINNLQKKLHSSYEIENKYTELEEEMWRECESINA